MNRVKRILLAEDDPRDVKLTLEALSDGLAEEVMVVPDGEAALDYLYRRGEYRDRPEGRPVVILLDIKMPRVDGLEVLRQVKSDEMLRLIPVVMLTSSREESDLLASYRHGANAFVVKPVQFEKLMAALRELGSFWALVNEPPPGRP